MHSLWLSEYGLGNSIVVEETDMSVSITIQLPPEPLSVSKPQTAISSFTMSYDQIQDPQNSRPVDYLDFRNR